MKSLSVGYRLLLRDLGNVFEDSIESSFIIALAVKIEL